MPFSLSDTAWPPLQLSSQAARGNVRRHPPPSSLSAGERARAAHPLACAAHRPHQVAAMPHLVLLLGPNLQVLFAFVFGLVRQNTNPFADFLNKLSKTGFET